MTAQVTRLREASERRKWLRFPLDHATSLTAVAGGRSYACDITDISLGGLRLRFDGPPPSSDSIVLSHRAAGNLAATSVWRSDAELGIAFRHPEGELAHLLQCISLILNPDGTRDGHPA